MAAGSDRAEREVLTRALRHLVRLTELYLAGEGPLTDDEQRLVEDVAAWWGAQKKRPAARPPTTPRKRLTLAEAESIAADTRTGICGHCGEVIYRAGDECWRVAANDSTYCPAGGDRGGFCEPVPPRQA